MNRTLLEVRGLRKSFGALLASDDVDLEVLEGETHAIIGPNGAGKTTLISQLAGNLFPDRGRVLFAGEDITALSAPARARRGFARSFQITSIYPDFTALENVMLAVQAHSGSSAVKSRSEEHTSELQSLRHLVCRLLLEKKKKTRRKTITKTKTTKDKIKILLL